MKIKLFLVLIAALTLISLVSAQPTGIISNVLQGETQVMPAQPLVLGGGPGGSVPRACVAGSPASSNITVFNPNAYSVTGTLWMNLTSTTSFGQSSVLITGASNLDITLWGAQFACLIRVRPSTSPYTFLIPSGFSCLPLLSIVLDVPGNYTWTMWLQQY